jgi:hypothetical protein
MPPSWGLRPSRRPLSQPDPPLTGSLPPSPRFSPFEEVVDGAEVIRDPVLASVADQEDVDVAQLPPAVSAGSRLALDRRWLVQLARLPVRALDGPGDDVLKPTEDGTAVARRLIQAKAVVFLDAHPTPRANLVGHGP